MKKVNSKMVTLFALLLFSLSLFLAPASVTPETLDRDTERTVTGAPLSNPNLVAEYPDSYTRVEWNQGTVNEQFTDSWNSSHFQFGPLVTWELRNVTDNSLIEWTETVPLDEWINLRLKVPLSALEGSSPYGILFHAGYYNMSMMGPEGEMTQAGTTGIMAIGMYFIQETRWDFYSTTNGSLPEGPPGVEPGPDLRIKDIFGPEVDAFLEFDEGSSIAVEGAENYFVQFRIRFNQSATPGFYHIMGMAVDTSLMALAQSQATQFGGQIFGATFDELVFQAVGGYFDWTRVDDDGNILLSANRGEDFNMTATITNGTTLSNVTVLVDLPNDVLAEQWVYGPYTTTEEVQGAWVYDVPSQTYIWDATMNVTKTVYLEGLHPEMSWTWLDLSEEYMVYDPNDSDWFSQWTWPRQAIVYHFENNSYTINLAYDYLYYQSIPDEGGYYHESRRLEYRPFPMDGSIPMPYVLNESASGYSPVAGKHVVNFRGHISEDMLPTGGDSGSHPLYVREIVMNIDGKGLAPLPELPIAPARASEEYELLRQLAIESPTATVYLTHKGEPYRRDWMFQVDAGETFTVTSLLQGGAELANDVDGIALFLHGHQDDWGFDGMSEWWQYSDVDVEIKISDSGEIDLTVYNSTHRSEWFTGEHYEWQYIEVFPGYWEWREVVVWGDYWRELWYDFEYDQFVEQYIPYHHNKTIMDVHYMDVGNVSYALLGEVLRASFDVTPTAEMPEWEWDWEFFYGNLTLVTDWESGEEFRLIKGWIDDVVYSYLNGTERIYTTPPVRNEVFRNNLTDALYSTESFPYIVIDGRECPVQTYYQDMGGALEERVVFSRWDPEGWNEDTQSYNGADEFWYQLMNGTRIDIEGGAMATVYNITLDGIRSFQSFYNWTEYNPMLDRFYLRAINGTTYIEGIDFFGYTSQPLDKAPAKRTDSFLVYANGTIPIVLAARPIWEFDHYVLFLNETHEMIHAWFIDYWDDVLGRPVQAYHYFNMTDGKLYLLETWWDGQWYYIPTFNLFTTDYKGSEYYLDEMYTRYSAFTKISGEEYPLPAPGIEVWNVWDLDYATPRHYYVYINGSPYEVREGIWGYDPLLGYSYPQFWANMSGTIVNLTLYSYSPTYPWNPMYRQDLPYTAVANGTIRIPELEWIDWTIAIGHTDPDTRQFVVEDWLDVVTGMYDSMMGPNQVFSYNSTGDYNYIETTTGEFWNYTQNVRAYFFNVTLANGTYFYTLEPYFHTMDMYNNTSGYYEVLYHYFIDLNGTERRIYYMPRFTFRQLYSEVVDDVFSPNLFEFMGFWYDIHQVEWQVFHQITNGTTAWEVIDLMNDWEMRFNIPSFNFSVDGGTTWYHVKGAREMIYRAYWGHGFATKIDYSPMPVTILRTQDRIVIGAPRYGMWNFDTWTVNEETGALDLDGDLDTTFDQFYVKNLYQSSNTFNVTEEYLWVNIMWEPNSTLLDDEFHLNSYTGMVTFNRTNSWSDTFIWYYADTFERVSSVDMALIQDLLFDENGHPAPGYWGISWMGQNFTSADLEIKAEEEGWDWFGTSQEWSWIWWDLQEGYSTEVNNGTHSAVMDISVAYAFAGMLAWEDTDADLVMDIDLANVGNAELSHYWMPDNVDSVSFTTPGIAWGNPNATDMEYRAVNETIDFGVSFINVSGMVFPFGEYSYFDWYDGQYYGSDFATFDERPTQAVVDEFAIDVHFTGYVNETGANYAEVKFDVLVGDWAIDAPGGRDNLAGRSLAIAFYSDLTIATPEGTEAPTYYWDDFGQPVTNDQTVPSSNYTMGTGLSSVAMMGLGGAPYTWTKNRSMSATVSAQSVPLDTFSRMYISGSGGSATAFNVTTKQFYTLIGFRYWGGYEVEVDPVFVGYVSRGSADIDPPEIDSIGTPTLVEITGTENMRIEIQAHDDGSDVAEVKIWDTDNNANYSATYIVGLDAWVAFVPRLVDGRYDLHFIVVAIDNYGNERLSAPQTYTFRDNIDPTVTSVSNSTSTDGYGREIALVTAEVDDTGGSGVDTVVLTYSNVSGSFDVDMVENAGIWEGVIPNQPEDTYVPWHVTVTDGDGNTATSDAEIYHFAAGEGPDTTAPSIGDYQLNPAGPTPEDVVTVSVTILDSSGVASATLQYRIGAGDWQNVTMTADGSTYSGDIPAQPDGTTIYYRIVATDTLGNEAVTVTLDYTVEEPPPTTPTTTTATTSTTSTTTTTTTTEVPPIEPLWIMVGALGVVVVIILVILVMRRK